MTYKAYNERLEGFNILVKAKNFLVFQVSFHMHCCLEEIGSTDNDNLATNREMSKQ